MRFNFHAIEICVNGAGEVEISQSSADPERGNDLILLSREQLPAVIDVLTQLKDSKEEWHLVEAPPPK